MQVDKLLGINDRTGRCWWTTETGGVAHGETLFRSQTAEARTLSHLRNSSTFGLCRTSSSVGVKANEGYHGDRMALTHSAIRSFRRITCEHRRCNEIDRTPRVSAHNTYRFCSEDVGTSDILLVLHVHQGQRTTAPDKPRHSATSPSWQFWHAASPPVGDIVTLVLSSDAKIKISAGASFLSLASKSFSPTG